MYDLFNPEMSESDILTGIKKIYSGWIEMVFVLMVLFTYIGHIKASLLRLFF